MSLGGKVPPALGLISMGPFFVLCFYHKTLQLKKKKRGVSHRGLAIYIKNILRQKKRIIEIQIFHHAKNIIFKKVL